VEHFAFDLSILILPEPGAIYRVEFLQEKNILCTNAKLRMKNTTDEEEEVDENDVNYSGLLP
jgi:hypothetical protein